VKFPDFTAHNEEQAAVWKAFWEGPADRRADDCNCSARNTIFTKIATPRLRLRALLQRPRAMFTHGPAAAAYIPPHCTSTEMGLPETWSVGVDLQNSYEAMWWGCPPALPRGEVPDTTPDPARGQATRYMRLGQGAPALQRLAGGPGVLRAVLGVAKTETFMDAAHRDQWVAGLWLRWRADCRRRAHDPMDLMIEMYTDPDFVHEFLGFITEAEHPPHQGLPQAPRPARRRALRRGSPMTRIQMLSHEHYRDFVLPTIKRLVAEFGSEGPNSIHCAADATHHFSSSRRTEGDELRYGLPVDTGGCAGVGART